MKHTKAKPLYSFISVTKHFYLSSDWNLSKPAIPIHTCSVGAVVLNSASFLILLVAQVDSPSEHPLLFRVFDPVWWSSLLCKIGTEAPKLSLLHFIYLISVLGRLGNLLCVTHHCEYTPLLHVVHLRSRSEPTCPTIDLLRPRRSTLSTMAISINPQSKHIFFSLLWKY